jgi:predicted RNA polymerase sigma factor
MGTGHEDMIARSPGHPSDARGSLVARHQRIGAVVGNSLFRRLGRRQESRAAYDRAIELAGNTAEVAFLTRRRDQLG